MTEPARIPFPDGFRWGVSTSSYQIEGAVTADGRGPSIWDTFAHAPDGHIGDSSSGDIACDHYHRWPEDVDLMAQLGVGAYRFSIAWPRIQPTGAGPAQPRGLAFYDQLVDALLDRGIDPAATLFHWDLPQSLQDNGGWQNRETAARFSEYAEIVARALGDRVKLWITLNEPVIHTNIGHLLGLHAPGLNAWPDLFSVSHHQLLGHGLAAAAIRRHSTSAIGIANNYTPVWPVGADGTRATAVDADREAAALYDAFHNGLYTDPLLLGQYPAGYERLSSTPVESIVLDGDLAVISHPLDVLGVNYYNPTGVSAPSEGNPAPFDLQQLTGFATTAFGWPVVPDGLRELLVGLHNRYGDRLPPIWITESGCAYDDVPQADGSIDDQDRIAYYQGHLEAASQAIAEGVDLRAYCAWSLLDNWEWAEGFTKRFGLVRVDFDTQQRTPKASFRWYRDQIHADLPTVGTA